MVLIQPIILVYHTDTVSVGLILCELFKAPQLGGELPQPQFKVYKLSGV
jgi:hypothetical protein